MFGPSHFSARLEGTSRLYPLGQYDGGVLHKSPGWSFLSFPFSLFLRWAQLYLRLLIAMHVPGKLNLGADMLYRSNVPQASGRSTHKRFRKYEESSAGQRSTFSSQKITLIAKLIFRRTGMHWPMAGPNSYFMIFPQLP